MELAVGEVLEGKVSGITNFGAFVSLDGGRSGLVHISEVAGTYVKDIHDFLQIGQSVRVKITGIAPDGKISLSIKRALEPSRPETAERRPTAPAPRGSRTAPTPPPAQSSGNQDFEDRLKRFMQESDSRIADNRIYSEHKQRSRRR